MFRRSASSLLLAGLLFADGSWLGRLEQLFLGLLGGENDAKPVWSGASRDSQLRDQFDLEPLSHGDGSSTSERSGSIDPNG